jgi:hypothetical protein
LKKQIKKEQEYTMKHIVRSIMLSLLAISILMALEYQKKISYQIGPGTFYSYYEEKSKPWALYVVEIDITNPYISLETAKGGNRLYSRDMPSSMSSKSNAPGHSIVSAINGDYYHTGGDHLNAPTSPQVMNGEFVWGFSNNRSAFSINEEKKPHIINAQFSSVVLARDTLDQWVSRTLNSVNYPRGTDHLVLFNNFRGASTNTNSYGFECQARAIDPWIVNDTVRCVIESREKYVGNMSIPSGKIVLSGHGTAIPFMETNFQIGDTVKIVQGLANNLPRLTQFMGGGPRMLQDGVDVVAASYPNESIGASHCSDRHPRTAIGFNQDSTKVYFVVVDGRQFGFSIGMSLYEMAAFMSEIGIAHAVNLDGGGSSSMVVRNYVMNKPSDGSERSVSNGILCVSSAPVGDLKHIVFERDSVALYKNKTLAIGPMGWDEHYNPKSIANWNDLSVSYNTDLGTFSEGNFTAAEEDGTTVLTAIYETDTTSIIIHIISLDNLEITPKYSMTDYSKTIKFSVTAENEGGVRESYRNDIFRFELLDPEIGTINDAGDFTATAPGMARIVACYGANTDTAFVNVEIGQGTTALDEIEDQSDYTLSADQYIDMDSTGIFLVDRTAGGGSKALAINYKYAGGSEDGNIYLDHDPITIYGLPSEILIDVLGDNYGHWIYVLLEDAEGKEYSARTSTSLLFDDDYRTLTCPMNSLLPFDRLEIYPMIYKGIRFRVNKRAASGTIYLDYIRVIYPEWTSIEKNDHTGIPASFNLKQNYPNPFNPMTHISYDLSEPGQVSLDVFNVNGKYVLTLVSEYQQAGSYTVHFNAEKLPTGIYYYRLTDGAQLQTKKMLLIK